MGDQLALDDFLKSEASRVGIAGQDRARRADRDRFQELQAQFLAKCDEVGTMSSDDLDAIFRGPEIGTALAICLVPA
jgi:hypothetical protein